MAVWLGLGASAMTRRPTDGRGAGRRRGRGGLREYYHPYTGAGMGARNFGWSSLVLELLAPDLAAARTSYLPSAPDASREV